MTERPLEEGGDGGPGVPTLPAPPGYELYGEIQYAYVPLSAQPANFTLDEEGDLYLWIADPTSHIPGGSFFHSIELLITSTGGYGLSMEFGAQRTGYVHVETAIGGYSFRRVLSDMTYLDMAGAIFAVYRNAARPVIPTTLVSAALAVRYQAMRPADPDFEWPPLPDDPVTDFPDGPMGTMFSIQPLGRTEIGGSRFDSITYLHDLTFGSDGQVWTLDKIYHSIDVSPDRVESLLSTTLTRRDELSLTTVLASLSPPGAGPADPVSGAHIAWGVTATSEGFVIETTALVPGRDPYAQGGAMYDGDDLHHYTGALYRTDGDAQLLAPMTSGDPGFYGEATLASNGSVVLQYGHRPVQGQGDFEDWSVFCTAIDVDTSEVLATWSKRGFGSPIGYVGGGLALICNGGDAARGYAYDLLLVEGLTGKTLFTVRGFSTAYLDGHYPSALAIKLDSSRRTGHLLVGTNNATPQAYEASYWIYSFRLDFVPPPLRQYARDDWLGGETARASTNPAEPSSVQESIRQYGPNGYV